MRLPTMVALATLLTTVSAWAGPRAYVEFLRDVVNLRRLAELPPPGATCRQFSSYDRRSRVGEDGTLIDWGANGDSGHFLRQDPE
ncbi:MAG: hypothetical protein QHJ73_11755, partial [Armatimonadota bacterium]|nr:hypothetical protein [Armatimonadota bacterium]